MLLAVDAEDALAHPIPQWAFGDALRGERQARRCEVTPVADDRLHRLVAQGLDAERALGERSAPQRVSQHAVGVLLEVGTERVQLGQVGDGAHDGTVTCGSLPEPHTVRP